MNRYTMPPPLPPSGRINNAYMSASMPYGDFEIQDLHSDETRQWRQDTPPPPDHYLLAPAAVVSREPFDPSDSSSVSSRGSFVVRQERADRMLHHPKNRASQKHPVVDCALNIYSSALIRASGHFQVREPASHDNLARWRRVCSLVRADFFTYRQEPTLAANHAESARFTSWLKQHSFIKPDSEHPQDNWGLAYKELTTAQLLATGQATGFVHAMFEPHTLRMAVIALNTAYDAGRYEFFEMKNIYGFRMDRKSEPDTPFDDMPETTERACKVRVDGGQVKIGMVGLRQAQVNERKRKIAAEIDGYTVAHQASWANTFI